MNLVSIERVTQQHAEKLVLDEVTLGVDEGDRVGVIGVNGSGKSTLLRLMGGLDVPDSGRVVHANRLRIDYVSQEPALDPSKTPLEAVLDADTPLTASVRAFEHATAAVRDTPTDRNAQERLAAATRAMDAAGGWQLEQRARANLDQLGVGSLDQPIGTLSGGQRKRVALARALTHAEASATVGEGASLLVLDEPTNHLDVDVVEWLEHVLRSRSGALLLVTHDRYLLDRVATRIVELDRGRLLTYHGSYADYLQDRADREERAAAAERRRQGRARTELAWLRRNPAARTSKAKARVERAETIVGADAYRTRAELTIDLPARRIGSKVVNLHGVGKSYGGRRILHSVDHRLAPRERLGIVGPNGSGKTTLLRLIAGSEEPDEGSVRAGETVHTGWYGQDPEPLPPRQRVIDAVKEVVLETNTVEGITLSAAQLLERFLFTPEAQKAYVGELSGGERRRLELLRVLATAPNLLLLDEPTNDLDLDTLAVLEDYLDSWPGTLVVASHDRFFLDRVCGHLFSIEPDGSVRDHPGGWSAYRRARGRASVQEQSQAPSPSRTRPDAAPGGASPGRPRKLSYRERRELDALDERISDLERRKAELNQAIANADAEYDTLQSRSAELAQVLTDLDEAEGRWLELSAIDEAARTA